jgi:hypothetical protein
MGLHKTPLESSRHGFWCQRFAIDSLIGRARWKTRSRAPGRHAGKAQCISGGNFGCRENSRDGRSRLAEWPNEGLLRHLGAVANFSSNELSEAIRLTFERRETPLPKEVPTALASLPQDLQAADWRQLLRVRRDVPCASLPLERGTTASRAVVVSVFCLSAPRDSRPLPCATALLHNP